MYTSRLNESERARKQARERVR